MPIFFTKISLILTVGLQVVIAILLIKRRMPRRLSWFFIYIVYELCESGLRLWASGHRGLYFRVYWGTEIGDLVLSLLAVWQSFVNIFVGYTRLRVFVWFVWSCIGLALLYSAWKAWLFPPLQASRLVSIIIGMELAVNFSVSVVGILHSFMIRLFRIRDREWSSAVITGFTINAGLAVVGFAVRSVFGTRFPLFHTWIGAVAYLVAEMTWLILLIPGEHEITAPRVDLNIEEMIERLNHSVRSLKKFLRSDK
jgi:hypothetical protein